MLVYGCGSHYINLIENAANTGRAGSGWAKKGGIVEVNKYFRNHQKEAAMLSEKVGKKPQLPNDTRWMSDREPFALSSSTMSSTLQSETRLTYLPILLLSSITGDSWWRPNTCCPCLTRLGSVSTPCSQAALAYTTA